jgi:Zn-dependent protease
LPLDGGQIARAMLESFHGARRGLLLALQISVAAGVTVGLIGWLGMRDWYIGMMFFLLAISNYQALRQLESAW